MDYKFNRHNRQRQPIPRRVERAKNIMKRLLTVVLTAFAVLTITASSANAAKPEKKDSVSSVCAEQQQLAALDGFSDFSCSDKPAAGGLAAHRRSVEIKIVRDRVTEIHTIDTDVRRAEGVVPMLADFQAMATFTNIPSGCFTSWVCTATVTNSWKKMTSFWGIPGTSYTCASLNYKQVYDVYYPWHALLNVRYPEITSGTTWPCSQSSRTTWQQMSSMPYSASSGADMSININLFIGGIGVIKTMNVTRGAWFDGRYNYSGINYGG
jgi:hypothetical protein